jgi:hypothetical protein
MSESDEYVARHIELWIRSGFYRLEEIDEMVDGIIDDDCDVPALKALILPVWQRKLEAERSWPQTTDCDRLDGVFYQLHEVGICALSNAGYTMSDGFSDVAQAIHDAPSGHYHGFCFYHGQDVERVLESADLMIAFGSLDDDPQRSVQVGQCVVDALKSAGFEVCWDKTVEQRIQLRSFEWQRRLPRDLLEGQDSNYPGPIEPKGIPLWPIGLALVAASLAWLYYLVVYPLRTAAAGHGVDIQGSFSFVGALLMLGYGLVCFGPWYFRLRLRTPQMGGCRALDLVAMLGTVTLAYVLHDQLQSYVIGL